MSICKIFNNIWALAGYALTLALFRYTEEYIHNPYSTGNCVQQTSPFRSSQRSRQECAKIVYPFFQEVKHDIIFRCAQLKAPRRQEELQLHIQAHLLSVVKTISALLEHQDVLTFVDGLSFLWFITHSLVGD
jgi:hypothetical protein